MKRCTVQTVQTVQAVLAAVAMAALSGCMEGYNSPLLGVTWKAPNGFNTPHEEAGPPKTADFGNGLILYSLDLQTGPLEPNSPIEALSDLVRQKAKLPAIAPQSAIAGTLPVGNVVRYEYKTPDGRELMYLVPMRDKTTLVRFYGNEKTYGSLAARVEGTLSTLRIKP
jgi:hypothetical protein